MSASKLFNIPANTLVPGPNLRITRGPDGRYTADMDFRCRKFDVGNTAIQTKLAKGTRLTMLYSDLGTYWEFLRLDEYTATDEPGGITVISATFSGVNADPGSTTDETSIVYTRNASLREEPIYNHPDFIALTYSIQEAIKAAADGKAELEGTEIRMIHNGRLIADLDGDAAAQDWYARIVTRGNDTYLVPSSEWTKSATGIGALTDADLADLGKIVANPPGNPAKPADQEWLLTGATENLVTAGTGTNSYSLTWTSGNWDSDLYGS